MEEKLLKAIEERLESLRKDERECLDAIQTASNGFTNVKSDEQLEYEQDLAKIQQELESAQQEQMKVKELLQSKQAKLQNIQKEESLLKDKEQLMQAIQEVSSKFNRQDGTLVKSNEQIEYENDLAKVEKELQGITEVKREISSIDTELNGFMNKYHIAPEKDDSQVGPEKGNSQGKNDNVIKLGENDKFQPPAVKEDDKFQPPAVVSQEGVNDDKFQPPVVINKPPIVPETALAKTGLQVFREQFNKMPEIKGKHTISENPLLPIPGSLALALATAGIISGPIGWAGAIGVAAISYVGAKPILRSITGQSKLEKQITEQFNNMDVKDLKLMADYLTEEKIIELKPNAVILKALNNSLRTLANRENKALEEEIQNAQAERDELAKRDNLTPEEKNKLSELSKLIDDNRKEIDDNELRSKNARRGKERISANYKGNVRGSKALNVFHKRNSTTAEYEEALNAYADAELNRLKAQAIGDSQKDSIAQKEMEEVGEAYTYTNSLGLLRSPFNMRQGEVQVVSDTRDNTVRNIGVIAMTGAALHRTLNNMHEMENISNANNEKIEQFRGGESFKESQNKMQDALNNITDKDIQGTANAGVGDIANAAETGAMREFGTVNYRNTGYAEADAQVQHIVDSMENNANNIAGNGSVADKIRKLADLYSSPEATSTMQNLGNVTENAKVITGAGVDHSSQFEVVEKIAENNEARASLYRKIADIIKEAENMAKLNLPNNVNIMLDKVKADFVGPIMAAATSIVGSIGVDMKRNQETRNDMNVKEENVSKDEEQKEER